MSKINATLTNYKITKSLYEINNSAEFGKSISFENTVQISMEKGEADPKIKIQCVFSDENNAIQGDFIIVGVIHLEESISNEKILLEILKTDGVSLVYGQLKQSIQEMSKCLNVQIPDLPNISK